MDHGRRGAVGRAADAFDPFTIERQVLVRGRRGCSLALHARGGHVRNRPHAGGNATPIAGKTGTAEVDDGRAHSWFVGFAPFGGAHRIAFAVIVENAGYGARAAAPVAGEIVTPRGIWAS